MVSLTSLWLPILVSAVAVFVVSSIMHMVLPLHKNDFKAFPQEDAVLDALRRFNLPAGDYVAPRPASSAAIIVRLEGKGAVSLFVVPSFAQRSRARRDLNRRSRSPSS